METETKKEAGGPALCLTYSMCFFESFQIKDHRTPQWRLLHALLGRHYSKEISRKTLNDLLKSGPLGSKYELVSNLLKDLHLAGYIRLQTHKGTEFPHSAEDLATQDVQSKTRIILTPEVHNAVQTYVRSFLSALLGSNDLENITIDDETAREIMRPIYDFQITKNYAAWHGFILKLAELSHIKGVDDPKFGGRVTESTDHWLILNFLCWDLLNNNHMRPRSGDDLRTVLQRAFNTHVVAARMDVELKYLAACKILEERPPLHYIVTEDAKPLLHGYGQETKVLRDQLINQLQDILTAKKSVSVP